MLQAIHHACLEIADEVAEKIRYENQSMEFQPELIAQVAIVVTEVLCSTWPNDLLAFARYCFNLCGFLNSIYINYSLSLDRKFFYFIFFVEYFINFLRHGRRSIVNVSDIRMLMRRNDSLVISKICFKFSGISCFIFIFIYFSSFSVLNSCFQR